jgi:hypothetical protein
MIHRLIFGKQIIFLFYKRQKIISKRRRKRFCEPRQNGNLSFTEGKNDVLRPIVSLTIIFLTSPKLHFRLTKAQNECPSSQKITLRGVGNNGFIDFPTSPRSHFCLSRRQKLNKKGEVTT